MFKEEKVIDGILCYRLDPNSNEWIPMMTRQETMEYLKEKDDRIYLQLFVDTLFGRNTKYKNPYQMELAF